MKTDSKLTYENSGVNRDKADRLVEGIRRFTRTSRRLPIAKNLKSSLGGYASIYALSKDQWIAATTDGVGTKLKLAFELESHSTIGQDLVAMSVNDLICVGARPLFFLDYFATSKLDAQIAEEVISGIARACEASGCLLVGGETAEMPGIYSDGEYDLAGFAVGSMKPADLLPQKDVRPGDVLIGIASSGFHSNGFSLIRKIICQPESAIRTRQFSDRASLLKALLEPTALYPFAVAPVLKQIKGAAHITGSGFLNVPRICEKVSYEITLPPLKERAQVFHWLQETGQVEFSEASQTFNMGIGMVLCVSPAKGTRVLAALKKSRIKAWKIGNAVKSARGSKSQVQVRSAEGEAVLEY